MFFFYEGGGCLICETVPDDILNYALPAAIHLKAVMRFIPFTSYSSDKLYVILSCTQYISGFMQVTKNLRDLLAVI